MNRFTPADPPQVQLLLHKILNSGSASPSSANPVLHPNKVSHSLPTISSDEITGVPLHLAPGSAVDNSDNFVSITEFATVDYGIPPVYQTVAKKSLMTFIVMCRGAESASWEIARLEDAQDFINDTISKMFEDEVSCLSAFSRMKTWGLVGTICLQSSNMDALNNFRRCMASWLYKSMVFDSFPKDILSVKGGIFVLLKGSMRTFKMDLIPKVLFHRNNDLLAGKLRILATESFAVTDKSSKGESKQYWRNIELWADPQFHRCLQKIPESRLFFLRVDQVQIRGGLRPPENVLPSGKRSWDSTFPPPAPVTFPHPERSSSSSSSSSAAGAESTRGKTNPYSQRARGNGRSRPSKRGRYPRKAQF